MAQDSKTRGHSLKLVAQHSNITRGHPYKIYKQHTSCSVRSSYFSERVANIWNSLPVDTDFKLTSLARFIHCI